MPGQHGPAHSPVVQEGHHVGHVGIKAIGSRPRRPGAAAPELGRQKGDVAGR